MTESIEGSNQSTGEHSNQVDIETLIAENSSLKASKDRVLNESKDYKAKYNEAKELLNTHEKSKLEKQGEYEQLLLKEREEAAKLRNKIQAQDKSILVGNIRSAFNSVAKDAHSIDDLLRMPEASNIQYDEDTMEVDLDSVLEVAKGLRSSKGYLFGSGKIATQASGTPAGDGETAPRPKSLKKMTDEELRAALLKM